MQHESNVSRSAVSRPSDVPSQIHSGNVRNATRNNSRAANDSPEKGRNRIQGFEKMLLAVVAREKQVNADYNRLYDGYESLVIAHAKLLMEVAVLKNEHIRYPFNVSERVVIDINDKLMEML